MQRAFRIGHEVGDAACSLIPAGVMISGDAGLAEAARATQAALAAEDRRPLFEATFIHAGVVVRVDLMLPEPDGWHVVEVKSTTRVKPYQRADLATQLWVMRECGVPITQASIRVIDTSFVLREPGMYDGLFVDEPAGDDIEQIAAGRAATVAAAHATLAGEMPRIPIGSHCSDPFPCSFNEYCRRNLAPAPVWPATILPGVAGKALARRLGEAGVDDLMQATATDIPAGLLARVREATVSGVAYHDAGAVAVATGGWAYPRTFLDFETIAVAVPRWIGTSPYSQVPFQFSAHIERAPGELDHVEFLAIDGDDPRERCAGALASLPDTGSVIAWNAGFERSCLLGLAEHTPMHADALRSLADRLVDLLPIARRHYYHRDMRGSWSIKAVLPTLAADMDYAFLEGAKSGVEAQDLYREAVAASTDDLRRAAIRDGLLAYCRHDTLAMVVALRRLCDGNRAQPIAVAPGYQPTAESHAHGDGPPLRGR